MTAKRWQDWVVLILGIYLFFSPFFLSYTQTIAASNAYVIGIAVVVFAILALIDSRLWEEWVNLILGIWLIISPFVLGYSNMSTVTWNHVILGLLIGADALWVIARPGMPAPRPTR
jgi:hypothetical protein